MSDIYKESLRANFADALNLPSAAIEWLLMLWDSMQFFDDVADGDHVTDDEIDRTIWDVFIGMNQNTFFLQNTMQLLPCLALMFLKWRGSDTAERAGQADAKSYMWRAGYYDVVLMAVQICNGPKKAAELSPVVMSLYGETLDEYLTEFKHA